MKRGTPPEKAAFAPPVAPSEKKAWVLSALVHVVVAAAFLGYALFTPDSPATAVFELVSAEPASLRPPAPKAPEPAAETPPPPEPAPEPEAPALVSKPKDPKVASKPEPKKPSPARDSVPKASSRPAETSTASADGGVQVANATGNPALSRWAGRVRQMIHPLWNPPKGVDVDVPATTVVRFNVAIETGEISDVAISKGSGSRLLDEEALRAVKRRDRVVAPKNVVPGDFSEDFLQVSYEFIYKGLGDE